MLEYLFMICQYMDGDLPVMQKVTILNERNVCSYGTVQCSEGMTVEFVRTKEIKQVRNTECLYVTKENKNELTYQD